jgi:hypothetical protein
VAAAERLVQDGETRRWGDKGGAAVRESLCFLGLGVSND